MIPRPKNTDTMADVLKMRDEYLKEKEGGNFKPAAVAIQKKPSGKINIEVQNFDCK